MHVRILNKEARAALTQWGGDVTIVGLARSLRSPAPDPKSPPAIFQLDGFEAEIQLADVPACHPDDLDGPGDVMMFPEPIQLHGDAPVSLVTDWPGVLYVIVQPRYYEAAVGSAAVALAAGDTIPGEKNVTSSVLVPSAVLVPDAPLPVADPVGAPPAESEAAPLTKKEQKAADKAAKAAEAK